MTDYYRGQDEIKPVSCPPMTFSRALEGFVRKTMMGIEPFCEREFLDAFAKTVEASTKIDRLPWSDPNSKPLEDIKDFMGSLRDPRHAP